MTGRSKYAQRIRARADELRNIISEAQAELDELEVAERVINRMAADQDDVQDGGVGRTRRTKEPTIADMAVRFLKEVGPLSTHELLEHMRENWREDLGDTTLTSTLSRTKNAGRITYADGVWHVADASDDEASAASSASQDAGAGEAGGGHNTSGFDQLPPSPQEAHENGASHVASRFVSDEP